ncbi:MAG: hypothetical protein AB7P20_05415 [Rhizobiaceae bacterium]
MSGFIDAMWQYKFSLLPVFSAYFVFEISTIIRRLARIAYTPIYFVFFPLGHADSLYAQYFNEDDFYGIGETQTREEKNYLRKKIVSISIFSMIFATVINPALAGVFSAIFLSNSEFQEFFWFLALVKLSMISISLYRARSISFVAVSSSFFWLCLIYVAYFVLILRVVDVSYVWAVNEISSVGIVATLLKILDLLVFDFAIYIIMVAAIGAAISYWMTDPDNIAKVEANDAIPAELEE